MAVLLCFHYNRGLAAIPKEKYDALEAIAEGDIRIMAVVEWNMLVEEHNCKKLK